MFVRKLGVTVVVFWALSLVLGACAAGPSTGASPVAGTPDAFGTPASVTPATAATDSTPAASTSTGCFAEIPSYPGANAERSREGDIGALMKAMGGQTSWFPGEFHVFATGDSPDKVIEYYADSLPKRSWTQASKIPGKSWGFVRWAKDRTTAQMLTGIVEGRTLIVWGCSQSSPTATPVAARAMTLKQAFVELRQQSALNDLAFYGYEAFKVDESGKTADFTVSGYSKAAARFCYLRADGKTIKLTCRDQNTMAEPLVEDMNKLKDSSELVAEVHKKHPVCAGGVAVSVNLLQSEAQFLCSGGKWGEDISPYK